MLRRSISIPVSIVATTSMFLVAASYYHETPPTPVDPVGVVSLDARLSHRALPTGPTTVWAQIMLNAGDVANAERPPMDVVLLIDHSGSMAGDKLAAAKESANALMARMNDDERLAIVTFDNVAEVNLPLTSLNDGGRALLAETIEHVKVRGGTNIGAAYAAGANLLHDSPPERSRVMFLLSDGVPTVGTVNVEALRGAAADGLQNGSISLTTLGIGDDFDETVMGGMAVGGGGHFYYVESPETLARDLNTEWAGLSTAAARGVTVQLTPSEGVTITEVHGFSTRKEARSTFVVIDKMFANSRRSMLVELAVEHADSDQLLHTELTYDDLSADPSEPRRAQADLAAKTVQDWTSALTNSDVMRRVRVVESMTALEAADRAWSTGHQAEAQGLLSAQQKANNEFSAHHGWTAEVASAQKRLNQSQREISTLDVSETRSIRIRKKRKADTIEIIAGDR